ncbi:MAG: preprotein translocase subunit SecE [Candidatus Nomurabacteria bacterium]|jgi:preprotein translocase SecE subunit|nr:preprotein translocase subunit SecE [Candidatus Nomurabacteria bacterium]
MSQEDEAKVVRRIRAKTGAKAPKKSAKPAKTSATKVAKAKKVKKTKSARDGEAKNYFVGAWRELRQVHWTNRKATWKLTLAVILFSLFFALLILLFDWVFETLIQETIL